MSVWSKAKEHVEKALKPMIMLDPTPPTIKSNLLDIEGVIKGKIEKAMLGVSAVAAPGLSLKVGEDTHTLTWEPNVSSGWEPPVAKPISFKEFLEGLKGQKLHLHNLSLNTDFHPGEKKAVTVTFELAIDNPEGKAAFLEIFEFAHKNTY